MLNDNAYLDTVKRLEPDIAMIDAGTDFTSIAISLKRIADSLTTIEGEVVPSYLCLKRIADVMEKRVYYQWIVTASNGVDVCALDGIEKWYQIKKQFEVMFGNCTVRKVGD